ncbi:hypothetical protein [Streptomyces sp. NPDC001828]
MALRRDALALPLRAGPLLQGLRSHDERLVEQLASRVIFLAGW